MIERFFSDSIVQIGTQKKVIYTAPIDMNFAFVTGLFIANTSDRNTTMEVSLYQAKKKKEITITGANTPLPAGSTAAVAAMGQRLQLTPGDYLSVKIGHDKCADVLISVSEVIYTQDDLKAMEVAATANKNANTAEEYRTTTN